MHSADITIINKLGLHARAAAKFVSLATQFQSEIQICRDERCVNGKSIMGVMMLAAAKGAEVTIRAEGGDSQDAVDKLCDLISDKFGEPE